MKDWQNNFYEKSEALQMSNVTEFKNILNGKLIINNFDSVMTFGYEPQNRLREISKSISEITFNEGDFSENTIRNVLEEIEKFQSEKNKKILNLFISPEKQYKKIMERYKVLFSYMDKMILNLNLQQAQLIKDSSIMEHLAEEINKCISAIDKCVGYGNEILNDIKNKNYYNYDKSTLISWMDLLSKRLEDLKISSIVSLQTSAEISIIISNNRNLINKISSIVSNTIPIWRNQASALLNIEIYKRKIAVERNVTKIADDFIEENTDKKVNFEKLKELNGNLENALKELSFIEEKENASKQKLNKLLI